MKMNVLTIQWLIVLLASIILFFISPWTKSKIGFFQGTSETSKKKPSMILLTSSLVISWIFAKSITNAANLGKSFGIVGGLSYAMYYLSFIVAGVIIYRLRTKGKFKSIHDFLQTRFGRSAVVLFSLVIGFRLFNEVWSNTSVIGNYFGASGSFQYTAAIIVFTGLTLAYALKGGMRSSLITDLIQMTLFGVLLFIILGVILPQIEGLGSFFTSGSWEMAMGLNLFFAALIQIFSYPFHDPVMTDRGFLSDPKTTLKSFILAGIIGFIFITLFSFVGIYAGQIGAEGDAAVAVAQTLGVAMMLLMNFIMITSAASTLDSTFTSSAKLAVVDLSRKKVTVWKGRFVMILTALAGSLPLLFSPEIIKATTVSGTMVIGLAPIFLFSDYKAPKISFHLSFWCGILAGLVLIFGWLPESLLFSTGKYADLLAINVYGTILCFVGYLFPFLFKKQEGVHG